MSPKPKVNTKNETNEFGKSKEIAEIRLTAEQKTQAVIISILGWIVPGAGHWYLGKFAKGLTFFIVLNGLFFWGMILHGEIAIPILDIHSQEFNFVNILIFIFGCGNGIMTILNLMPFAQFGNIALSTYEVGTLFMVVSGSLNVFITMNAWDLYRNEIESQKQVIKK